MAFNSIRPTADAEDVEQIINALTGVSGAGQLIGLTQVNDSSNYALDVRNLDTTNSYGLRVRDASSNNLLLAYKNAVVLGVRANLTQINDSSNYALDVLNLDTTNSYGLRVRDASSNNLLLAYKNTLQLGASAATDALTINCNISGKVYIGDSANANMTTGLTINQGGAGNEIISLQSSGVAHGVTSITETDTFGSAQKSWPDGGLLVYGLAGGTNSYGALYFKGVTAAAADTSKGTGSGGVVRISANVKSGTTTAGVGVNGNLVSIDTGTTTRFVFDAEGDIHCDAGGGAGNAGNIGGNDTGGNASPNQTITGYNTYDEFDDVQLVRVLEVERNGRGLVEHNFDAFLHYNRADLERLNLAHFGDDGHTFVNYTGLARLHSGAIWQMWTRMQDGLARLALVEQQIAALPGPNALPAGGAV